MSGGTVCRCRPQNRKYWVITAYKSNCSAFNGNRLTRSDYSAIRCMACDACWRTKAAYVEALPREGSFQAAAISGELVTDIPTDGEDNE